MRKKFWIIFVVVSAMMQIASADEVILRVTGNISKPTATSTAKTEFTLNDLSKLDATVVKANTMFTGPATFKGPLVRDLLKLAGANPNSKDVIAIANDGYTVRIPIAEFLKYEVIAAYEKDNVQLKPDNRGPIWLMYPLDKYPKELKTPLVDTRLVWSLKEINVQ